MVPVQTHTHTHRTSNATYVNTRIQSIEWDAATGYIINRVTKNN